MTYSPGTLSVKDSEFTRNGPLCHYSNPYFFRLVQAAYNYLEGNCEIESVCDEYETLRDWTEDFLSNSLPGLRHSLAEKQRMGLGDPFDAGISYSLSLAVEAARKGFELMDKFIENERDLQLRQAILQLQLAYDNFGHAAQQHSDRIVMLRAELAARARGTTLIDEHRRRQGG